MIESAELLTAEILNNIVELNEELIIDPNNLSNVRVEYDKKNLKSINEFYKAALEWSTYGLAAAYLAGIRKVNLKSKGVKIIDGANLLNYNISTTYVPPIPGKVIKAFKNAGIEEHINFYNIFRTAATDTANKLPGFIIRKTNDIYRHVAAEVGKTLYKEGDVFTRRRMSQQLINGYAKRGIQCITYRNGAVHTIDNYSEMVARTMTARTSLQASVNRLVECGVELCQVSSHFRACHLCVPYEGRILTIGSKKSDKYESLDDAKMQGLFHCNCLHSISVWTGEKVESPLMDKHEKAVVDKYGYKKAQEITYKAQQKQRYYERKIRQWKRNKSIGDERAQSKIRYYQAQQRKHLDNNPYLPRKYIREQIKTAH